MVEFKYCTNIANTLSKYCREYQDIFQNINFILTLYCTDDILILCKYFPDIVQKLYKYFTDISQKTMACYFPPPPTLHPLFLANFMPRLKSVLDSRPPNSFLAPKNVPRARVTVYEFNGILKGKIQTLFFF